MQVGAWVVKKVSVDRHAHPGRDVRHGCPRHEHPRRLGLHGLHDQNGENTTEKAEGKMHGAIEPGSRSEIQPKTVGNAHNFLVPRLTVPRS